MTSFHFSFSCKETKEYTLISVNKGRYKQQQQQQQQQI